MIWIGSEILNSDERHVMIGIKYPRCPGLARPGAGDRPGLSPEFCVRSRRHRRDLGAGRLGGQYPEVSAETAGGGGQPRPGALGRQAAALPGECFFGNPTVAERRIEYRDPPPAPWGYTDDTTMALSIVRCLKRYGHIEREALAASFAKEYARDPRRGYGGTAHGILQAIGAGTPWQEAAGRVFSGEGSCGNGGAMRSGPIGAYYAGDLDRVVAEAKASAEVTHAHPDGQTGAIAVALAAAWMVREAERAKKPGLEVVEFVLERLPETDTFYRLKQALELPLRLSPQTVALRLGNRSQVIASDTVPFCLWCAARHPDNFQEAIWSTVSVSGDIDTNCAIVGGIVALSAGCESIPAAWLSARESFNV